MLSATLVNELCISDAREIVLGKFSCFVLWIIVFNETHLLKII